MVSLLRAVSSKIIAFSTPEKEEINFENIDEEINDIRRNGVTIQEPQNNLNQDEEGCFFKTGKISLITNDYVLIENKYMCELSNVALPVNDLRVGNKVDYLACRVDNGEGIKVLKIISKVDGFLDGTPDSQDLNWGAITKTQSTKESTNINVPKKKKVLELRQTEENKNIGKVVERAGRKVILEDGQTINLDHVSSNFVPIIGDWLQFEFSADLLEVTSIAPLGLQREIGQITKYNTADESGIIQKNIFFIKAVCAAGYIPCEGDQVYSQFIKSDQGVQLFWRALTVVPIDDVRTKYETDMIKIKPVLPAERLDEITRDKKGIEITNGIEVTIDANESKEFKVTVKNNGSAKQVLKKCFFLKKYDSQLSLVYPNLNNQSKLLNPTDEIICTIRCKARFVGHREELMIFQFRHFDIGRLVKITVNSLNLKKKLDEVYTNRYYDRSRKFVPQEEEDDSCIRGVKPYSPARFIKNRPIIWKIPPLLWSTMKTIVTENKTNEESAYLLANNLPVLQKTLNYQNYKQKFECLLYLEEIALILNMQRYQMEKATLGRAAEFLKLSVPGLAEKRPSLIIGDRVMVTYTDVNEATRKYEGYVHKIRSTEVFLKFDPKFHEIYQKDQECQVSFKASTTVIQRSHTAVATVVNKLGKDFLFPTIVHQKESQFNFMESDDEDSNPDKKKPLRKKIHWINKKLNKYQKNAVKNILKGLARPLPYVIFGPPGTGKTVTVCESILQILFQVTDSRILVATPSNSSANLITERLLDSKLLQTGDLVRLVAHHYIESEHLPVRILPYCVTADISDEGSRANVNISDPRGCKLKVTLSHLQNKRIIIGTCSALGILHNMGCPAGHFTHVLIDEAGQASEPELMIPLSLAHAASNTQVVLAGDPKQLGPVNQSRYAGYFGLSDSFLVRLLNHFPYQRDPQGYETGYDPRLVTKLLMNYRSLPDLLALPNQLFYEAELIPMVHRDNSEEAKLLERLSVMLPRRIGSPPPVIFHGVEGKNLQDEDSPSWYNLEEVSQVYIYLLELYNNGLQPEDIGVITPYAKQVYKIRMMLAELDLDIPKVGSVEEFQGQERKVIILSTVRTAEDKLSQDLKHSLGFVKSRERLNVAITRARTLLIIIGNPNLLQHDVCWRSVLEHCDARSSWIRRN